MKLQWTKHLPEDQRSKFEQAILSARLVLERQTDIIEDMERKELISSTSSSSYDTPSWAYKAADTNGYLRALREVKQLLNLDQQKDKQ